MAANNEKEEEPKLSESQLALKKEIKEKYISGEDPISYSGITNIKRYYPEASIDLIKEALSGIETYTLFREPKFPRYYNPVFVVKPRELIQADLIDLQSLQNTNDNVKYLLVLIDSFTRYAWVRPLKSKNAKSVLTAFKDIVENDMNDTIGDAFLADQGTEFVNKEFKEYLKSKDVEIRMANNKAPHVERFNRTLQNLLYRYMEEKETERYIDQLQPLVKLYNNRYHRTIKMSPKEAEQEDNRYELMTNISDFYESSIGRAGTNSKKTSFKIGDLVRISKHRGPFYKGYYQSFLPKIYEISEIVKLPITMYKIKDIENNRTESGTWYASELQKVDENYYNADTIFKIEEIIKWRGKKGKREGLVKWKYWPEKYNSWEPESAIKKIR